MPRVAGVELVLPMAFPDPSRATHAEVEQCRRLYNDAGLHIPSVQSLAFGKPELQLLGEQATRDRFLAHLERMAQLAHDLGATRMVFGSPANRRRGELPADVAMDRATDFFLRLGDRLVRHQVTVCIEPNPPIYAKCDFILRMEEAILLVDRVRHPQVKVQLDTGALLFAEQEGHVIEDPVIEQSRALSGHVHLSLPGLAHITPEAAQLKTCVERLLPLPQSWLSIEMMHGNDRDPFARIIDAVEAATTWFPIQAH